MSVRASPQLQAALLAYRAAPKTVQAAAKTAAKTWGEDLRSAAQQRATGRVQSRIAASGRVQLTAGRGARAVFGSSGSLSGPWGRTPLRAVAGQYEFGSARRRVKTAYRSRYTGGAGFMVKRLTRIQIPVRAENGNFAWPAVADVTPDVTRALVAAVAAAYREA